MAPNPKHARTNCSSSDDGGQDAAASEGRSLKSYIPPNLRQYVRPYHGDFCLTPIFHDALIAQLMMEGFLPIATTDFVLPKLHSQRCVIQPLQDLHISRQVRKRSKRYYLTVNQNFDDVVAACRQQHGDHCWLYPALVDAFKSIHNQTRKSDDAAAGYYPTTTVTGKTVAVRLYSVEVWNVETGALAAGELGYAVGSMYTSLTGFCAEDSAGSVQLAALGKLLAASRFTVWDLGMEMAYKMALGARLVPRADFVRTVHAVREQQNVHLPVNHLRLNCRDVIDSVSAAAAPAPATVPPLPPTPKQPPSKKPKPLP